MEALVFLYLMRRGFNVHPSIIAEFINTISFIKNINLQRIRSLDKNIFATITNRFFMPLPELELYYRTQRKKRFEEGWKPGKIHIRNMLYSIFRTFLTVDRIFRKQSITVINPPPRGKERAVFACTHIGENDLENIYEKLGRGCWWFVGDPRFMYRDISGLFVYLNGCIFLDTDNKEDRRIAYLQAVELLKAGGSLMIFPEGARNGSENLPVMPLFYGAANMAMETGTPIIPVAIEQYDKRFVINFGNEICPDNFRDSSELTQFLRDTLAVLKWNIWEKEGVQARGSLPENFREQFLRQFEKRIHPYDTLETVEQSRFHTKAEIEQREAFTHLKKLIPCPENAFLFRKSNKILPGCGSFRTCSKVL